MLRRGREVVRRSALGLKLKGDGPVQVNRIKRVKRGSADRTWEQPWGERRYVRNHYNEMRVGLVEKSSLKRPVAFRVRL